MRDSVATLPQITCVAELWNHAGLNLTNAALYTFDRSADSNVVQGMTHGSTSAASSRLCIFVGQSG